jgi:hypothetical protein
MMLPWPNAPNPRPVELFGPIAAQRPIASHARRIATPARSCRLVTDRQASDEYLRHVSSSEFAPPLALDPSDRQALVDLSLGYAAGIDHRDWSLYRSVFADSCEIDFSSWSGRAPATMPAEQWVDAVRRVNGYFDATQHLMSNHRFDVIDHHTVVGTNELQAQHWFCADSMSLFGRPAEPAWCLLGGHYTNRYVRSDRGWQIAACRLTVRWRTGDETIFAFARQRGVHA